MKVLLLVGSPRKAKSASETLGAYLLDQLKARGARTEKLYVYSALRSEEKLNALIAAVATSDLVIISTPLYWDSLPAAVTELLEILNRQLKHHLRPAEQRLVAISNCGFPEAYQNDIALRIYRRFAHEAGFVWAGGIAMGSGEVIKGKPLPESGGVARNAIAALDMAAKALAEGGSVPQDAKYLMAEPLMPAWLYRSMGDLGWRIQARKHGTLRQIRTHVWKA